MDLIKLINSSGDALTTQTKHLYVEHVKGFLEFLRGVPASGQMVEAWRDYLVEKGLAAQSVNNRLWAVKFASKRLAELSQDPKLDFARYARPLKEQTPQHREALTVDQVRKILSHIGTGPADLRDRSIIILATRTGLRRGGICSLMIEDMKDREITVTLKGESRFVIYLDDETHESIMEWMKYLKKHKVTSGPIFRSLKSTQIGSIGSGLSAAGVYRIIKTRAEKAGFKAYPHLFRHTAISLLTAAGEPTWRIQRLTGQKTAAVIDRYRTDYEEKSRPVSSSIPSTRGEK